MKHDKLIRSWTLSGGGCVRAPREMVASATVTSQGESFAAITFRSLDDRQLVVSPSMEIKPDQIDEMIEALTEAKRWYAEEAEAFLKVASGGEGA